MLLTFALAMAQPESKQMYRKLFNLVHDATSEPVTNVLDLKLKQSTGRELAEIAKCQKEITAKKYRDFQHDQYPLELAIANKNAQVVETLIQNGADVNLQFASNLFREHIHSPVSLACELRDLKLVKFLVSKGADVTPKGGSSPFTSACAYSSAEMFNVLSEAKLDFSNVDIVFTAAEYATFEMFTQLQERGADFFVTRDFKRPVYFALRSSSIKDVRIIQTLLDNESHYSRMSLLKERREELKKSGYVSGDPNNSVVDDFIMSGQANAKSAPTLKKEKVPEPLSFPSNKGIKSKLKSYPSLLPPMPAVAPKNYPLEQAKSKFPLSNLKHFATQKAVPLQGKLSEKSPFHEAELLAEKHTPF